MWQRWRNCLKTKSIEKFRHPFKLHSNTLACCFFCFSWICASLLSLCHTFMPSYDKWHKYTKIFTKQQIFHVMLNVFMWISKVFSFQKMMIYVFVFLFATRFHPRRTFWHAYGISPIMCVGKLHELIYGAKICKVLRDINYTSSF